MQVFLVEVCFDSCSIVICLIPSEINNLLFFYTEMKDVLRQKEIMLVSGIVYGAAAVRGRWWILANAMAENYPRKSHFMEIHIFGEFWGLFS